MQYRIGQYILDCDKHVLLKEKDRALVSDSYRIIEVLVILAKEYPRVVSRTELLEAVWPEKDVTDWALSRLIADIRRLLGDSGEQDQILTTVHGMGFRLAVPVTVLTEENPTASLNSLPSNTARNRTIMLGVGLALALLVPLIVFFARDPESTANEGALTPEEDPRIELQGQRLDGAEKTETLPFTEGWSTTNSLPIDFRDGASFSPTAVGEKLGYQYFGPANLNNAVVLFDISVSQGYIDSGAALQPYAILLFGNWRGEWDCAIENSELSTQRKTFECKLDEPGAIFNIGAEESIRIGVQSLAQSANGTITVHKVQIKHAPSFVDQGWVASDGLPVTYHGGVEYQPKDGGQRLEFKYNGPENLQGATIVFTVEASQDYIDSGATILPFAQSPDNNWWGEWNCATPNSALSPVGSRIACTLDEPDDIFNLGEDESLLIGIMSQRGGQRMDGTVKIKNVEILFP